MIAGRRTGRVAVAAPVVEVLSASSFNFYESRLLKYDYQYHCYHLCDY